MKKFISLIAIMFPCYAFAEPSNDTVTSKLNDTFSFELESNPTTGYGWMIKGLPKNVALVGMEYIQSKNCGNNLGCGGVEKFFFKAISLGKGTLELKYGQPFEDLPKNSTYKYISVIK
ncbi:hypothetical protein APT_10058 (plasmid) [Acetobacter pasteurianus NBRC 101655]|uniref:Proteinase IV n=2 Tax=Acetobacter TaxID=434 RepID=A0A2G4RBK0_9PROT|nr:MULTISPECIES: protease inhibitor I42 family protein [Acetobacter]ANA15322.1 hypothetical protein WG31_14475 [Acetobacter oryzifermentans]PHY93135.1 proteinase IV [Acetobacter pomorum]BAU39802.1 hypothetical protein APT_10058 [Acetobacter pasteurianus NBRC 101655]